MQESAHRDAEAPAEPREQLDGGPLHRLHYTRNTNIEYCKAGDGLQ